MRGIAKMVVTRNELCKPRSGASPQLFKDDLRTLFVVVMRTRRKAVRSSTVTSPLYVQAQQVSAWLHSP